MFLFQSATPPRWHLHLTTAVHRVRQDPFGAYLFGMCLFAISFRSVR